MLEASNDPILEFSEPGGYTFNFIEREREEGGRERERERERERDLVHIDAEPSTRTKYPQ